VPGTAVRITATVGTMGTYNIDMALTDQQTPLTVANFLAYIKAGAYTNNIIHRSIHGFIIQDGGYYFFADANGVHVGLVPTFPPVLNEFGISNVRGTVAMAKIGTDPNSATSQWFINMADNSANLNNQNGGFTVFGRVIGNGMAVADIIGNLTTHDASADLGIPDWTDVPFTTQPPPYLISSFVITSAAVVPSMTYNVTSANTSLVTATLSGNILTLTPSATLTGSTNITITATDLEGSSGSLTEPVNVVATYTYDLWKGLWPFANTTVSAETADPDGDKVPNLSKYAFGGDPLHAQAIPGLPQAESGGGVTFYHQQSASLSYAVYESIDLTNWTLIWQTSNGFSNSAVFNHTVNVVPGFDSVTIRDPASKPLRFWRVQVSRTL
jgi:cyclophilin family peptidyl-prolyl cis-trans isomerase